ncbi:MAG: DoxX family protein [Gammaproteobacteria bacterium]|jgi:putative oxidoreductase
MFDLNKSDAVGKLILRLTVGILTLFHGLSKITSEGSIDFIAGRLASVGLPDVIAYGVFVGEILAPLLLIAGVFSRLSGLVIVINMLFAIGLAHMGDLFSLTDHGGYRLELQMFYLFGGLAIAFLGSGRYAFRPD